MARHTEACPDLSCVQWVDLGCRARLQMVWNERLIGFEQNKSVVSQFDAHNFKFLSSLISLEGISQYFFHEDSHQ